ncbi:uncharacterized protein N7483_010994 [Penicillium malachiteum]|uniref:uncharacterized protein n=1 Tax=Penicillium malachiteum TaxID=1324776 RepID=UPI00254664DA|nr:uncharacterized protein N7483_010994 [Penicillium malachiteum]KAJ5713813.1 hypothetical protein N7483_010994 [Penicillium malachiteum]
MTSRRRRDASDASIHLSRNAKLGRHLLSTFQGKPSQNDEELPASPALEKHKEDEPDINIHAAPMSSDEESELSESHQSKDPVEESKPALPTLKEKLVGARDAPSRTFTGWEDYKKKDGLARTSSVLESGNEGDPMWMQNPNPKRSKQITFPSSSNKASFSKTPTSSARSIATPEKSSQKSKLNSAKSSAKKGNDKASKKNKPSKDSDSENSFKVPLDFHVASPEKPKFKVPPTLQNDEFSMSSLGASSRDTQSFNLDLDLEISSQSSLSSTRSLSPLSSEDELQKKSNDPPRSTSPPRKALCPMCKAEVDPEMLREFQAQPKQRLREQQRFCASHKKDAATVEWRAHGYPDINWSTLGERMQRYHSDIEKYLNPETPSYYRNILESAQKAGSSLRLTITSNGLEVISCGYYGGKGAHKMLDGVMGRFSVKLRRLTKDDSLAAKVGIVGYAQSVLVPELAVRLIMEDMNVSADDAREIMRESIDIGQKLNPQQDDVVVIDDDEIENLPQE